MSIYCLHTTLTHDLHIFSPIPGVNGKLTQKLTHHLHIFLFLLCQLTNYTIIDTLLTHFPLILVSIYWLHTKLTHDWHIFSPIPGVNGKLTQKLTHQLHIFLSLSCQFTIYTKIDTLLTHFLLNLVSICWLHTKMTHCLHIFPGFLVSMGSLHKNWLISYTFLEFFTPGFHISRVSKCVKMCQICQMCQLCQPPSWHIHWHGWHMCQQCVSFSYLVPNS